MRPAAVIIACLLLLARSGYAADLATGLLLLEQGRYTEAQQIFETRLREDPQDAAAAFQIGSRYLQQGRTDDAVEWLERAVEIDDRQSVYFQRLGEAYGTSAQGAGMFKAMRLSGKIRDSFKRAVVLDGANVEARYGLVIYYIRAPAIAGGSLDKAEQQALEIARLDPLQGHLARASVYQAKDEPASAEIEYRAALALQPDEPDACIAFGLFLNEAGRYDDAIQTYEEGLSRFPDDMSITYQIGRTASISGQHLERGERALSQYVEHEPGPDEVPLPWAWYRLGLIYAQQEREDEARRAYQYALTLDPGHKEAKAALKKSR